MCRFAPEISADKEENRRNPDGFQDFLTQSSGNLWREAVCGDFISGSLMSREIGRACELSCDEAVIRELDVQGRMAYGDTLINAIGFSGNCKDALASLTLNESKELLKERLDAIMNFKKRTKWGIVISLLLTVVLICGFAFSGAYTTNRHNQAKPNSGANTISLHTNSEEIVGFQPSEQTAAKDVALNITEDDVKIQLRPCLKIDGMPNGERFFRQSRQIFAGGLTPGKKI